MAPIYSGSVDVAPADEDISQLPSSLGQTIAASAARSWGEAPTSQLWHVMQSQAAQGYYPGVTAGDVPTLEKEPVEEVSREDALAKVKAVRLDKEISVPQTPRMSKAALDLMIEHAQTDNARAATIADGPRGFTAGALDFGTGFLVGAADPLNIAASFIPIVGEARYAKLLSSASESIMARAAIRAGTGAATGAAFGTAMLPLDWLAASSDGRDFTAVQALQSVLLSAGQFGFLHAGGGLAADFWRSFGPQRGRRPLYPFAPGEPFERRPAPAAPELEPSAGVTEGDTPTAPPLDHARHAEWRDNREATPAPGDKAAARPLPAEPSRPAQPRAAPAARTIEEVLSNPRVGPAFAELRIDSSRRVPYGAGADTQDPRLVHVDEHIPHQDTINGVTYDPRVPVALHEIDERDAMEHDGLAYPAAHRTRGETAEKAWVDQHLGPGAWPIYTKRWDGWLSHIEHETIENVPETLYTKPYPFKEREHIARVARHEATMAGERAQIAKEVSTAVERAGRPREEARAAGELFAARYATRAARFGHRSGSPLEMFRAEHIGIRRGAPNIIYTGRAFDQRRAPEPDLFAETAAPSAPPAPSAEPEPVLEPPAARLAPLGPPQGSPEYQYAYAEHGEAAQRFRQAQDDYRAGRIGDQQFLAARAAFDEATRMFDRAFAREETRGREEQARAYEAKKAQPSLAVQREAEGQLTLPGAEREGVGTLAQRQANAPLKPRVAQKPMDVGLFGDESKQKSFFQEAVPSWYYSAVGRAVEASTLEKAAPEQWLATIKQTPGVKKEELDWLGLEDWLKAQRGQVTKEKLAEYLRANRLEVREVVKGDGSGQDSEEYLERYGWRSDWNDDTGMFEGFVHEASGQEAGDWRELPEELQHHGRLIQQGRPEGTTKFEQWTLPGGENYRELLLTLPEKPGTEFDPAKVKIERRRLSTTQASVRLSYDGREIGTFDDEPVFNAATGNYETKPDAHWIDVMRRRFGGIPDMGIRPLDQGVNFRSPHWDEPNVIAHVRFDAREVGNHKVLHVAEIQSDWHQAGRRQGYREPIPDAERPAAIEKLHALEEQLNAMWPRRDTGEYAALQVEADTLRDRIVGASGVPDAPFKSTSSWASLAFKRIIRYAVDHDFDRITWDTGATSAERYDLSKRIGVLRFDKSGSSGFTPHDEIEQRPGGMLTAFDHSGNEVLRRHIDDPKELADHIGKEAADKLLAQTGEHTVMHGTAMVRRKLEGLDLKVGGEGMRGFYDKILPAAVEKITKKFGAEVERSEMPRPFAFGEAHRGQASGTTAVHSLDITDKLREAAQSEGFPLFQHGPAEPRGRITLAHNRAIIDLFKNADASTFLHEAGHLWLEELVRDAAHGEAPQQMRDDLKTVLDWLGVEKPEDVETEHHEQFARGFEQYLMEGRAPSKGLAAVFEKFREWLAAIYRAITALNVPLTDEVRGVMERMLASDPEIAEMQAAMRRLPEPVKEDLLKATIGSMADGKGSPAAEMLKAGAGADATVAGAAKAVLDRFAGVSETEATKAAEDAWREIAERPAPHEEEAAKEAFAAAEALPEPPSIDAEPARVASLAAAKRAAAEGADIDVTVRKAAPRGPRGRPEATWSLMEFIASRGGIDPGDRNIGDVRALLGKSSKFIPGFGHLVRKGGMSLDRAREAAVNTGYLRDIGQTEARTGESTSTINDLLELLDEEARGRRQYREGVGPSREADAAEIERHQEEERRGNDELDTALREYEVGPLDPALRTRTLEIMVREGEPDPIHAWERAVMERDVDEAEAGELERSAHAIPGWDEPHDAGAAPGEGGRAAGAAKREGAGPGAAARAAGEGAREAGGEAKTGPDVDTGGLSPIARAAVEADQRSAASFTLEIQGLPEAERAKVVAKVEAQIAAINAEATAKHDAIVAAAAALSNGEDVEAAIAQASRYLAPEAMTELAAELRGLDGLVRTFEQEGLSKGQAAQKAADQRIDRNAERAAIARRAEREHAAAVIRETRRLSNLQKVGVRIRDAIELITAGVNRPFYKSRNSIEAAWHTLHNKYVGDGGVDGALRRAGLAKLVYSQEIDAAIEREMHELDLGAKGKPGVTKNPQALEVAKIFHAADKQALTDHNLAGGWVRSLSGHTAKQQWNPEAIRAAGSGGNARRIVDELRPGRSGQEADRLAFLKDFLENLDLKRTFGRMPMGEIRDALYELWIPLKNGDHFEYSIPHDDPIYQNVAGKAAAPRAFFFKSAAAARAMRQKYGLYPSFIESKYRGLETMARQTALVGRLGPRPEKALEEIVGLAKEMTRSTNERQQLEHFVGNAPEVGGMLAKQMGLLTGKSNRPLYALGARIASGWMVWERMSMLGRVLLTHLEGLPTKSSELRYWGVGFVDRYKGFFSDMTRAAPESDRGKLMQLIWAGHDADNSYRAARYDSADTAPGVLSRLSDVYFRLTGVTHVLPNQRQGAQHMMARELAMERGKAYADVDPRIQRILRLYGIEEPEWKALHGAEWTTGRTPDGSGPGGSSPNAYLTPEDALKLSDESMRAYLAERRPTFAGAYGLTPEMIARARNELATAIATMYADRGLYAMFSHAGVRTKARLYGATQPGTLAGIGARLLWQFKQWPVEMIYRAWGREIYGGNKGLDRVASIVELAVAATVMGTLGELVRDASKGQNPFPRLVAHPIDYLLHGLVRSGVGSIAGDYLFGEFDRHWRTVLESIVGPTLGQINDIADLYYGGGAQERHPWKQRGADLLRLAKTNGGPLVNFWATSWAFEYLLLHRLQDWINPGYTERWQRKMERERGVSFILSPTAAIGR